MKKQGVILLVHGNRRADTKAHFDQMACWLSEQMGVPVQAMLLAAAESFDQQLDVFSAQWVSQGLSHIQVVPMLLGPGRHLEEDVPALTQLIHARFPEWQTSVQSALGVWPELIVMLKNKLLDS